uniref:Ankyrin repeat and SOCS box containing 10 n=1 Tax=Neogobius melanostomus TaxID=47308 RepID=A0A8C6U5S9_9GOBI
MSRGSFVFSPTALRSLAVDAEMLERQRHSRQARSCSGYMLKKEARDRAAQRLSVTPAAAAPPAVCRDAVVQNALYTGDVEVCSSSSPEARVNMVIEPQGGDMRWTPDGEGLWSLTYEQELTTPLHITASRGFTDCLCLLLQRGANVDLAPGGITALHEACENCQPECTRLLLLHGANANAVSEDGLMPLHFCSLPESLECAKYLLQYGAVINGRSLEEDDTPLHTAARNGLVEHVEMYLRYGAHVDRPNNQGLTALNAACAQPQERPLLDRYFRVCQILIGAGADVRTLDQDKRTPLHLACKNANPRDVPMHNILKVVWFKTSHQPERVVRALLNHGSIRLWPGNLPLHCSESPRTIEVLLNVYSRLKVNDKWVESVPPESYKAHQYFYDSVFALAQTPRSLQHLCRCRIRIVLDGRLHKAIPKLNLPTFLKNYLLLDYRGYVH